MKGGTVSWMLEHLTLIGAIVVACAGFAATVGGLAAAVGAYREQRQLATKSDEIARLAIENAALSQTIAAKSDEIARLTKDNLASVTGGESFVYLEPLRQTRGVRYFFRHAGAHPTFDVVVRVQEIIVVDGKPKRRHVFGPTEHGRTLRRGSGFDWTYPDPTPPDSRAWPLIFLEPATKYAVERNFRVEMMARNGIFIQRLRVWPVGGRWYTDSKTLRRAGVGALALPAFDEAQAQGVTPEGRLQDDTEDN